MANRLIAIFGTRSSLNSFVSAAVLFALCVALILAGYGLGVISRRVDVQAETKNSQRFRVRGDSMLPTLRDGQVCELSAGEIAASWNRGDLVAIRRPDGIRVKRLAGIPGDTVNHVEGRLTINGRRLEDLLQARASGEFIAPARVEVVGQEPRWTRVNENWLVYTHRDPHRGGMPGPIMDDYPANEDVSRRLHKIDRLAVQLNPPRITERAPRVVFYRHDSGPSLLLQPSSGASGLYLEADAVAVATKELFITAELSPSRPIAVEDIGQLAPADIRLYRHVEYRDDRLTLDYPIKLGENEYFVLGDNVPVSVDSRSHGPIESEAILGRITIPSFPDPL